MKKETNFETSPLNTQETKAEAAAALTPSATNGDKIKVSFYFHFKLYAFKNTAISRCASMSPLFPIFSWTDSFYFSEHPTKIVCISHADSNTNFIHSHICEAKQLLGSGDPL